MQRKSIYAIMSMLKTVSSADEHHLQYIGRVLRLQRKSIYAIMSMLKTVSSADKHHFFDGVFLLLKIGTNPQAASFIRGGLVFYFKEVQL